ncbi:MAG TPA: DUF2087 domain-containing protein [Galbitalea sp.]
MAEDWRRIIATLADPTRRLVYASIVADVAVDIPPKKREKALAALSAAGLIVASGDGFVASETVFAELLTQAPAVTRTGIERFIRDGRIEQYPARPTDRDEVLAWAATQALKPGEVLTERALNERLLAMTDDVASLRRYLVDAGLVVRDAAGSGYSLAG